MTGTDLIQEGNALISKGHARVAEGIALLMQEVAAKASAPRPVLQAPDELDWMPKRDFCKRLGISGQTADNWVRAGKVEKIHDSTRKVRYRMLECAS